MDQAPAVGRRIGRRQRSVRAESGRGRRGIRRIYLRCAEKEKELKGQAVTAQERAVKAAEKEKELKGQAVMAQERAEKNFEARSAVDAMLTTVGQQTLAYEPHMEKIRRDLLKKALDFQEGFLKEKGDDAEIQDETGRAYARGRHPGDARRPRRRRASLRRRPDDFGEAEQPIPGR